MALWIFKCFPLKLVYIYIYIYLSRVHIFQPLPFLVCLHVAIVTRTAAKEMENMFRRFQSGLPSCVTSFVTSAFFRIKIQRKKKGVYDRKKKSKTKENRVERSIHSEAIATLDKESGRNILTCKHYAYTVFINKATTF